MKKILVLCFLPLFIHATELIPWYGRDLEPHFRADYLFQNYNKVHSSKGVESYGSNDNFLNLGVEGTYAEWQAEGELLLSNTRKNVFALDCFKLTGRYQWMSDIIGDPFTLTTGLSLTAASTQGLEDISSFHHGRFEGELHLSAGKEFVNFHYWTSRIWGVIGLGMGNEGSPWLRGDLAWEKNWCDLKQLRIFMNSLWGAGDNSVDIDSFSGYGSIDHASVDVGVRYSIQTESWGRLALQYAHRIHACNFPQHANRITISLHYPLWF